MSAHFYTDSHIFFHVLFGDHTKSGEAPSLTTSRLPSDNLLFGRGVRMLQSSPFLSQPFHQSVLQYNSYV